MDEFIDVSLPVSERIPLWPGSPPVRLERRLSLSRGDPVNETTLGCSVHTGTHIDAPLHFLDGAAAVDRLALDVLIGPARVVDLGDEETVSADALARAGIPAETKRLLIRTRNSMLWTAGITTFRPDYVALDPEAARWVVDRGIRLLGVDYLSVQRFTDPPDTHLILLGAGVVVVEGLNLAETAAGGYELICLPIRLAGAEGAPVRAVLRRIA